MTIEEAIRLNALEGPRWRYINPYSIIDEFGKWFESERWHYMTEE